MSLYQNYKLSWKFPISVLSKLCISSSYNTVFFTSGLTKHLKFGLCSSGWTLTHWWWKRHMQTQHCREGAAPSRPGHALLHSCPSDKIRSLTLLLLLLLLKQVTYMFFRNHSLCVCPGHTWQIEGNHKKMNCSPNAHPKQIMEKKIFLIYVMC